MATDPYETLGVSDKATQDEIKGAYRKLAKNFHPDLNPGNKKAESRFKEISAAYDLIGNEKDRAEFDRDQVEAESMRQYQQNSRGPFYNDTQQGGGRYSSQFEGLDDDMLNSIFAQMGRHGQSGFQGASGDELYQMDIEFKDSVLGAEREITLPKGKKFMVKIPAGVESGVKLRFAGQGETTGPEFPPADVYVKLNVKPSLIFKRVGRDIEMEMPVSFSDAVLGAEIKVPTVDGSILMNIPPNVNTGQKLRVKGKGVVDSASKLRGDQFVVLKINMPEKIDDEFRKAIEDWTKRQASGGA